MKNFIIAFLVAVSTFVSQAQGSLHISSDNQNSDQYLSYNFGSVFLMSNAYVDFSLTAKGPLPTEFKKITIGGMGYNATTDCPVVLEVGKTCTLRAYFSPQIEGPAWGDFNLYLNDGNIFIRLFGQGIKY
jgi:hypothetical protein